jgi:hypothetical protein
MFTEWINYISDEDLQTTASYHTMIMSCPNCGAMFQQKACGNRTIFPWFGYHPTDGNVKVITEALSSQIEITARDCLCKTYPRRVQTVNELREVITKQAHNALNKLKPLTAQL